MFARTFTLIALIAAAVLGVNAACDNGTPGFTHIVVSGDTCFDIAIEGGISLATLENANPGINCDDLFIGQRLCVPSN